MFRLLMTILLFFAGVGLVVEHLADTKYSVVLSSDDEDSNAAKDSEKTQEESGKEKFFYSQFTYSSKGFDIADTQFNYHHPFLPSGFTDKPFTPPDLM